MDSKISVIIPIYNRAHLLAATLDSVFAQTRRVDQIIVVDDGSTDDPARVCAQFADRVTYRRIDHAGASAARNAGLEIAQDEFIAFLDSDDLWEARFLERMTAALDASDAGFVYCDYATFNARGLVQPTNLPPSYKLRGNLFARLLETDFISTGALLIRRECLDRVGGFDPHLEIAHDWDLWLRLAREFDAEYVDEPLARIRLDSDGLTRDTALLYSNNLRILAKLRGHVDAEEQRRVIRRNTRACHRALFKYSWGARRPLPALKHFGQMLTSQFL